LLYPNQIVGMLYDHAPSHSADLERWVAKENKIDPTQTTIVIGYIDKCLTAVYQPCDIVINKPLKSEVRKQYAHEI
ncbi:MAG: hypothetical protein ACREOZ_04770, partial [Gloeomargaritales cyanobacterium]